MARLLQDADAKVFFTTKEEESPKVQRAYALPTVIVPSVEELIGTGAGPSLPYSKTFVEAARDPIVVCPCFCEHHRRASNHNNSD